MVHPIYHAPKLCYNCYRKFNGDVAEWSIALPWKGKGRLSGPGVRISSSPPLIKD